MLDFEKYETLILIKLSTITTRNYSETKIKTLHKMVNKIQLTNTVLGQFLSE